MNAFVVFLTKDVETWFSYSKELAWDKTLLQISQVMECNWFHLDIF